MEKQDSASADGSTKFCLFRRIVRNIAVSSRIVAELDAPDSSDAAVLHLVGNIPLLLQESGTSVRSPLVLKQLIG